MAPHLLLVTCHNCDKKVWCQDLNPQCAHCGGNLFKNGSKLAQQSAQWANDCAAAACEAALRKAEQEEQDRLDDFWAKRALASRKRMAKKIADAAAAAANAKAAAAAAVNAAAKAEAAAAAAVNAAAKAEAEAAAKAEAAAAESVGEGFPTPRVGEFFPTPRVNNYTPQCCTCS
jgi:hypothetical protein